MKEVRVAVIVEVTVGVHHLVQVMVLIVAVEVVTVIVEAVRVIVERVGVRIKDY